jgi:hypothetical protein
LVESILRQYASKQLDILFDTYTRFILHQTDTLAILEHCLQRTSQYFTFDINVGLEVFVIPAKSPPHGKHAIELIFLLFRALCVLVVTDFRVPHLIHPLEFEGVLLLLLISSSSNWTLGRRNCCGWSDAELKGCYCSVAASAAAVSVVAAAVSVVVASDSDDDESLAAAFFLLSLDFFFDRFRFFFSSSEELSDEEEEEELESSLELSCFLLAYMIH